METEKVQQLISKLLNFGPDLVYLKNLIMNQEFEPAAESIVVKLQEVLKEKCKECGQEVKS